MTPTREEVLHDTLRFLQQRADERGEDVELSEDMNLLGDLNWNSLEMVVIAAAAQERYQQQFPLERLFADSSGGVRHDISVREWVDFICEHLRATALVSHGHDQK
jgi:acyl carrier protein